MVKNKKIIKEIIQKYWDNAQDASPMLGANVSWENFNKKTFQKERSNNMYKIAAYVSTIAAIFVLGLFAFYNGQVKIQNFYLVENSFDKIRQVALPDGSLVTLHRGSSIKYSEEFLKNRNVQSNGTVFYQVVRDVAHPFTVSTGDVKTTVLGTSFMVRSEVNMPISVKLFSGSVQINVKDKANTWKLNPGDEFVYSNELGQVKAFENKFYTYNNGFIDLEDINAEELSNYIENRYGYRLSLDSIYYPGTMTFRLRKDDSIHNIMNVISKINKTKYQIDEEKKIITLVN